MLLEAAVELLIERGVEGLNMEALAAKAGVNKALPYQHFENAQAVLSEIYLNQNRKLGRRLLAASATHPEPAARLEAIVAAFFDVVEEDRAILPLLSSPQARSAVEAAEEMEPGLPWFQEFLVRSFAVDPDAAWAAAEMLQGMVVGAAHAWAAGRPRATVERLTVVACRAIIAGAASPAE